MIMIIKWDERERAIKIIGKGGLWHDTLDSRVRFLRSKSRILYNLTG